MTERFWFRGPDGSWQGVNADPENGTGEAFQVDKTQDLFPAVAIGLRGGDNATINLGTSAFAHPVPNGYVPGWPEFNREQVALDGGQANIEITLAQVPATGKIVNLMANTSGVSGNPAVTVTSLTVRCKEQLKRPATGYHPPVPGWLVQHQYWPVSEHFSCGGLLRRSC